MSPVGAPLIPGGRSPLVVRDVMLILSLALLVRLITFNGAFGSDDLTYFARAAELARGEWTSSSYNGALRYGFNLPAAGFMALFGESLFVLLGNDALVDTSPSRKSCAETAWNRSPLRRYGGRLRRRHGLWCPDRACGTLQNLQGLRNRIKDICGCGRRGSWQGRCWQCGSRGKCRLPCEGLQCAGVFLTLTVIRPHGRHGLDCTLLAAKDRKRVR